jgi:hypothetical protein
MHGGGVDGWLGVDGRVADSTGRYALCRGHDEPRKRTVHHASTYAQGRADVSRTSRAHAGAEPRTRYAGAPRPRELKLRRAGAALRRGGTRQCGRDRAAVAASRGCGELAGGTVRARAAPGLRTHRRGRGSPCHDRPGRARRAPTGETGPRRATAPWPRAGERAVAGTGPRAGERDRRPWPGRAGHRERARPAGRGLAGGARAGAGLAAPPRLATPRGGAGEPVGAAPGRRHGRGRAPPGGGEGGGFVGRGGAAPGRRAMAADAMAASSEGGAARMPGGRDRAGEREGGEEEGEGPGLTTGGRGAGGERAGAGRGAAAN